MDRFAGVLKDFEIKDCELAFYEDGSIKLIGKLH